MIPPRPYFLNINLLNVIAGCISTSLLAHVVSELGKEAAVLKDERRARESRPANQAVAGSVTSRFHCGSDFVAALRYELERVLFWNIADITMLSLGHNCHVWRSRDSFS